MAIQGSSNREKALFLSIQAGAIWDKKADESSEFYKEETYEKKDGSTGTRKGARYESVSGFVTGVRFSTHAEYGDSLNITLQDGGEKFIISTQVDNRYCGDLMKMLLIADLEKMLIIRPYDFIDQKGKRAMGISVRQDGEKISLRVEGSPFKDAEWFKSAAKRDVKRFFEDVTDYFLSRVKEEICPRFAQPTSSVASNEYDESDEEPEEKREPEAKPEVKAEAKPVKKAELLPEEKPAATDTVTPIAMKRVIRKYMQEVYPGVDMPDLKGAELIKWHSLCINFDELPIPEESAGSSQVVGADAALDGKSLKDQLNALL